MEIKMKKNRVLHFGAIGVMSVLLLSGCGGINQGASTEISTEASVEAVPNDESSTKTNDGIVQTVSGLIQGTVNNGMYEYLGVPYAEAKKRFVPAVEIEPWDGVFVADTYGAMSPQGSILGMSATGNDDGTNNNCQNLNIWTPGVDDGAKRPVMVWLHGGGFSTGTANDPSTDGFNLSKNEDVVVVSVNHRLNIFGHLDLSAYGEQYKYSANVGITDIVAALSWIQDNIEAFGGDPQNITVFGQSGGGAKVLSLMTSPYAKGLFQKGIVQSGATETMGVSFSTKEESTTLTEHVLENLGITADTIDDLQDISNADLQEAAAKALQDTANEYQIPAAFTDDYAMEWGPVVEGDYMPSNPVTEDGFAAEGRDIPLLIGSNLNEWTTFVSSSANTDMTEEERKEFAKAYPNENSDQAANVDTLIRLPMLKIMSHKADQNGAPIYSYVFTWEAEGMGSYHGAEIPFVFQNVDGDEEAKELAKIVSSARANFAKTGIPAADNLPEWKAYDREDGATMILDNESELVYGHDRKLMELLEPEYIY